jgi:hypothetical protein
MARATKASKSTKPATARTTGRKAGRPAKPSATATPRTTARAPAVPPAPKVSKDELRAQVEKLEQLVTSLRAKSRETNKAAKVAAARIAELEAQVAELEKNAAPAPVREPKSPRPARAKRKSREIDPGDAVPPGVAVEEPAPLDDEAETALENLETHLAQE